MFDFSYFLGTVIHAQTLPLYILAFWYGNMIQIYLFSSFDISSLGLLLYRSLKEYIILYETNFLYELYGNPYTEITEG